MDTKREMIRQKALEDRKKLINKNEIEKQIYEKLFSLNFVTKAKTFFCYVSTKYEIDTLNIIEKLIIENKTLCVPKVKADSCEMDAMKISSLSELKLGEYNILEPDLSEVINKKGIEIIIVPAVCFDISGYRLGYGKGYYDRYLADFKGLKIGLCSDQLVFENVYPKTHDIPVDIIITQRRIIYCNKN